MRISKSKFELAKARACMDNDAIEKAGVPKSTLFRAVSGKKARPETAGKIAKALGVDVTEIIE